MTQAEVVEYLRENEPATAQEIAEGIDTRYDSVLKSLNSMKKFEEVGFEKIKNPNTGRPVRQFYLTFDKSKKVAQLGLDSGEKSYKRLAICEDRKL